MKKQGQQQGGPRVLLFERDPGLRKSIAVTLMQAGIQVHEAHDAASARSILETAAPDMFLVEHHSASRTAGQLIEFFRRRGLGKGRAVLVTTTRRVEDSWRRQFRPDVVLYKPFDIRYLCRRINSLWTEINRPEQPTRLKQSL